MAEYKNAAPAVVARAAEVAPADEVLKFWCSMKELELNRVVFSGGFGGGRGGFGGGGRGGFGGDRGGRGGGRGNKLTTLLKSQT